MLVVDTDNGLGSPSGDIDDGFALAALIRAGAPLAAMTTVAGNTSEEHSFRNSSRIAELLGYEGPIIRPPHARDFIRPFSGRIAAFGPLTNLVGATSAPEVVIVGGWLDTHGRWPPYWPFEFNLTHDKAATHQVFESSLPLTIFPIDVARCLWARKQDVAAIPGPFGEYARRQSRRWFRRMFWLRHMRSFPVYDLAPALYLIGADGLTFEETTATMRSNTFIEFGKGTRPVKVCTALRRDVLWSRFLQLFA